MMDRHRSRLQRDSTKKETEEVDVVSLQPAYLCVYMCVNNWALKRLVFRCFKFSLIAFMLLIVFYGYISIHINTEVEITNVFKLFFGVSEDCDL